MGRKSNDTPLSRKNEKFMAAFLAKYSEFLDYASKRYARPGIPMEDIRQEAIVHLLKQAPKLRGLAEKQAHGYIFKAVRSAFCDLYRQEKRNSHVSLDGVLEEMVGIERELVPDLDARQEVRELRNALSAREWIALTGKYGFGYSQEELAQQLGMKPDSIRMFLSRLRKRCRAILEPEKVTGGGGDEK